MPTTFWTKTAAILTATALAANAWASDLPKWGDSGDWEIYIDPATGNGCFIEKTYPDGTLVQFGAVPAREGGFFAAYNLAWNDIVEGAVNHVKFDFDGVRFSGDAVGVVRGLMHGGYVFFDNPNLATEFAQRNTLTIITRNGELEFSLKGTGKAVQKVRECQLMQPLPPVPENGD